ncbi:putative Choline transporter-like protein, partial [Naja naja]
TVVVGSYLIAQGFFSVYNIIDHPASLVWDHSTYRGCFALVVVNCLSDGSKSGLFS